MDFVLPREWSALCLLVFVLGLKHGFDADHLATIDGLTRFHARSDARLARRCGALFSLGHGAVVMVIALAVSTIAGHWKIPAWMEAFGAWFSIFFLIALGLANLYAVLATPAHEVVALVGFKGRFLGGLARGAGGWGVTLVGALFAVSFDTLSQAVLFAVAATRFGGWQHAAMMAAIFFAGMLATDGINGLWISRLLRRADALARMASRIMGFVVAMLSLLVALYGLVRLTSPQAALWGDNKETLLGLVLIALVGTSFLVARWLARQAAPPVMAARIVVD
jgi:high-affinity nickel-transport protein